MPSGACGGDAGSPIVSQQGQLLGIVSWAIECGRPQPAVHTRVIPYLGFIREVTGLVPPRRS